MPFNHCVSPVPLYLLIHMISKKSPSSLVILHIPNIIFSKRCHLLVCVPAHMNPSHVNASYRGCVTPSAQRVFLQSSCSTPFHLLKLSAASKSQDKDVCVEL